MITVFRIEHKTTGVGPFQTSHPYTQELAQRAAKMKYLRAPSDDGLYLTAIPWAYLFGCTSLATLKSWFFLGGSIHENDEIVKNLIELGFVLAEYLVQEDSYIKGATGVQVAFDALSCKENGLVEYRSMGELRIESPLVFDTRAGVLVHR